MGILRKQIGWSQESNLLWEILRQLNKLAGAIFNLKPKYKVYTALLTQTGGDDPLERIEGDSVSKGVTYYIDAAGQDTDFSNIGAPNNNSGTYFVATIDGLPNNYGGAVLNYNGGAPVATVLENTIGDIYFQYNSQGNYSLLADEPFFTENKTFGIIGSFADCCSFDIFGKAIINPSGLQTYIIFTTDSSNTFIDQQLYNTPIEIRVYN